MNEEKPYDTGEFSDGQTIPRPFIADRQRAMLTRTDRELLMGNKQYDSEQGFRNARHRLREHIRHSLYDVYLVNLELEYEELQQILDRHNQLVQEADRAPMDLWTACTDLALKLTYAEAQVRSEGLSFEQVLESDLTSRIKRLIESRNDGTVVNVDVDISVQQKDVNNDKTLNDMILGNPDFSEVLSFVRRGNAEKLRERLQELDTEITPLHHDPIGPDDEIFEIYEENE